MSDDAEAAPGRLAVRFDALVQTVAALRDAALDPRVEAGDAVVPLRQLLLELAAYQQPRAQLAGTLATLGWEPPVAVRHLQWAPIARARLEASLVGVTVALLDSCPFAGEWSVRQQLAHCELTDVRYGIATRYAALRSEDEPVIPPAHLYPDRQGSPAGTPGESLVAIIDRMRTVRAAAIAPLLNLTADQIVRPTEWHTAEHTVGFRLHRFAAHDLELTTDIKRTLVAAGHQPTNAMRLAAALVEARGELDSMLLGVPATLYGAVPLDGGPNIAAQLQALQDADEQALVSLRDVAVNTSGSILPQAG